MAHLSPENPPASEPAEFEDAGPTLLEHATLLASHWRLLVAAPLLCGATAIGVSFLMAPTYTATTTFLPPQQQQSLAATAVSSLGPLAGLAGAAAGLKSPAEQYMSLLQSANIGDRIIERYRLQEVYETKLRSSTRQELAENVRISLGKKDGLITIAVDDASAERAANIANSFVDELRRLNGELALTEAQQRRAFFERQLSDSRNKLTQAQQQLQDSGFNAEALNAEPKAAAETYARIKAEHTAAQVKLQTLRSSLNDDAIEIKQALSGLAALQSQLAGLSVRRPGRSDTESDYVGKYREFKYQEALFDLFARQFEMAKLDESREGALIQVVDPAAAPDRRAKPRRLRLGIAFAALGFVFACVGVFALDNLRRNRRDPANAKRWHDFASAFRR